MNDLSDFSKYLTDEELAKVAPMLERLQTLDKRVEKQDNYMSFVKHVWPQFIEGRHHKIYAEKLQAVADGKIKRLIINMPPRHTKSEFASYLFPTWLMGRRPDLKIIQATHTAELAVGFGRKVKNLIDSEEFRDVFPNVSLASDAKASGRWSTNGGGEYYAVGVGGALAGRGADLAIIDDPVSEQDALSVTALDNIYEWYTSGPRQRLQPGGSIIIVMTRWSIRDLTAKVLAKQSEKGADQWDIVEFPAIMPSGDSLWPEFWSLDELESVKASIPVGKWNAQYMQNPTAEEGAIIKREWWNLWEEEDPPSCSYIIQSYDTAFSKSDRADYSAITTWGIFHYDETQEDHIVLLDALRGRWEFPELKQQASDLYEMYEPDMVLVEQKASGMPLTQELRRMGIPVTPFTPSRGADKFTRMHACAPVFESGMVWCPETNFADEVMEECAAFPNGEHDDLADSMTQAILRFRQGGFITTPSDYDDEDELALYRRKREYYQEAFMADQKQAIMQALMKAMGSSPSAPATSPRPKPRPRMGMGRAGAMLGAGAGAGAGRTISDADRRKIMGMMGESGKTISDADRQRAMDRAGMLEALEFGEMGMMSPIDLERLRRQLGMSRRKKPAEFNGGGAVGTKAKKKPKKGCVMKGRGGNFKGLK